MTIPTDLERIIAKQEIQDLCYRYARGADRLDAESWASAFWEDGTFNQPQSDVAINSYANQLVGTMDKFFELTHHINGNILINFDNKNYATTEVYFQAFHLTKADASIEELRFIIGDKRLSELSYVDGDTFEILVGGRYLDQVERREEVWKIKYRRLIFDYTTVRRSMALSSGLGMTAMGAAKMSRDRTDPSYKC
ncbi:nuclear transport factor 2 family protein [Cytobacillus purgationiresistens]|uniref:SnoaL-like domain-containing protein n=1 Tax=Cytobacillus purgationiresistens TaxID=863449 RepID=A0ABU0AJX0_9BACI|nr:nuclear transport factor 2 family protein [Cytobacillus purgationiresistens]MDQ0271174.1 hypothetical protein [Cytobacillus purgationiresistens]